MSMTAEASGLGANLRRLRKAAGMTQQQLAVAAGMTVSNVAQLERGKTGDPRIETVRALARALKVSWDELVGPPSEG